MDAEGSLDGRRVLVAGASDGIGRATVCELARAGASVALMARRGDALDRLVDEIDTTRGNARAFAADVRVPEQIDAAVGAIIEWLGGLDGVLYTVGVNRLLMLADTDGPAWRDLLETNLVGAALITRAVADALADSPHGRIGYLSSDSAARPFPGLGAYAVSKAALESMVAAWRGEEDRFVLGRIIIGPTMTSMAASWDPEMSAVMFDRWIADGRFDGVTPVTPEVVAAELTAWIAAPQPAEDLDLYTTLGKGTPTTT